MKRNQLLRPLLLLFVITLVLNSPSHAEPSPLKIGVIAPLSGPLAEYGQALRNGIDLAKNDIPGISQNCEFKFEDSKYDPKTALSALQKLAGDDVKVIYNWGNPTSAAVSPLAERLKMAMFVLSTDPLVSKGSNRVVRFSNSGVEYGAKLAQAIKKAGFRRVGIVRAENDYLNSILDGLKNAAPPDLSIEELASYLPSDTDFRSSITKIRSKKLDAIGVFLLSGQISVFYRQLGEQHLKVPTFGTDFFESTSEIKASGSLIDGAFFANNAVDLEFQGTYLKQFGNDFQIIHAANGYDFAELLCRDLPSKRAALSPDNILELVKTVSSTGKLGSYAYVNKDGDKHFASPIVIRQIVDQNLVTAQ